MVNPPLYGKSPPTLIPWWENKYHGRLSPSNKYQSILPRGKQYHMVNIPPVWNIYLPTLIQ